MKNSETTDELKRNRSAYIDHRWGQLYELQKETGLAGLQYLFLTNSGGAATTLAFIGAVGSTKIGVGVKYALASFVLGVILSGVGRAKQFHHMDKLLKNWKSLVSDYLNDKKSWDAIIEVDNKIAVEDFWDYAIPYASFGCFIIGAVFGFIALI